MAVIDEIMQKTQKVGKAIADTAVDVYDFTKVSYNIASLENKLKEKYEEIGAAVVAQEMSGEKTDLSSLIAEAVSLVDRINDVKEKRAEIKKAKICPECGKSCAKDSTFCTDCGTKL